MITSIAMHESSSLLRNVSTWILGGVMTLLFALLFLQQLESYIELQPKLALQDHPPGVTAFLGSRYIAPLAIVFLILGPLLAMRSFSDEFRQDTYALWQSSPVSNTSIVLGKFIGVLLVLLLWIMVAIAMLASMQFFVSLDWGLLAANATGLILCCTACAAVGLLFSTLTRHPLIAALASFALLLLLWLIGSFSIGGLEFLSQLSLAKHLNSFFSGYLSSGDILYFLIFTALFLALSIIRLNSLRHTGR